MRNGPLPNHCHAFNCGILGFRGGEDVMSIAISPDRRTEAEDLPPTHSIILQCVGTS